MVDPRHPFRKLGLDPGGRTLPPRSPGEQEQEHAERDSQPADGVRSAIVSVHVACIGEGVGHDEGDRQPDDPPAKDAGPFTLARLENSIRIIAMIGIGTIATPTANGRTSLIAWPTSYTPVCAATRPDATAASRAAKSRSFWSA